MMKAALPVGNFSLTREWMSEVEDSAATSPDQDTKDWAVACVAEGRAITGVHRDATRLALQIVDPAPRSRALAAIAAELHRQGERTEPLRRIKEARQRPERSRIPTSRSLPSRRLPSRSHAPETSTTPDG
jgi:hypothetical protein